MPSIVRLECIYEKYERYSEIQISRIFVSGSTIRACLLSLLDVVNGWVDSDTILEEEYEKGRQLSVEEIIEKIECSNGDGADYIMYIADTVSGKVMLCDDSCFQSEEYEADEYEDSEQEMAHQPQSSLSYYEWIEYMELEDNDAAYDGYLEYCRSIGVEP